MAARRSLSRRCRAFWTIAPSPARRTRSGVRSCPERRPPDESRGGPALRVSVALGALAAALLPLAAAAEIALRDDLGREVRLARPAGRIVTLAPFLTELVFSAGAGARLVGVSAHSDFPPEARALPRVASAAAFSVEAVAAVKPDLV